jgi:hypothetical protein
MVFFIACGKNARESKTMIPRHNPSSIITEQPLVFEIVEPSLLKGSGAQWISNAEQWNNERAKSSVYIFVHPDNKSALKPFADVGIATYASGENSLRKEWVDIVAKNKTKKKLLIFIQTHGDGINAASKGNFCYRNEHSCSLNEDILLEALQAVSKIPNSDLKDVLIVPLSCYNKYITDRFEEKANKLSWSFNITFLSQAIKDECDIKAFAYFLKANKFEFDNMLENKRDKFITDFFNIDDSLKEILDLVNPELTIYFSSEKSKKRKYEIRAITRPAKTIGLKDFGFGDFKIQFNASCIDDPFDKNVEDWLKEFGIKSEGHRLQKMVFRVIKKDSDKFDDFILKINGDLTKRFDQSRFKDLDFCSVNLVFSKNGL